eukprot:7124329-Pyramimonas_sp.AAC.1
MPPPKPTLEDEQTTKTVAMKHSAFKSTAGDFSLGAVCCRACATACPISRCQEWRRTSSRHP